MPGVLGALAAGAWRFVREHWRPFAFVGAIALAFVLGRGFRPPPKVETRTVDRVVEHVVTKTVTVVTKAAEQDQHRVVDRVRVRHRDGTIIERTREVVDRHATETDHVDARTVQTAQVEHTHEASRTVTPYEPRWHIVALAGTRPALLPRLLVAPSFEALDLGLLVEHRLFGPVWIGAWGLSSGVFGLALSITF